ncbi:unnamed protein product [Vitrella brassicaformis CCMP3155]|uniref:CHCH domain-containing protein n=2 Tax=Vitrella brassicaformis TaxID=1169539 RepID=A0A0G4F6G2_VITBC|nr:unnamed protein product [Vitrella brassicaformis CCMP3155]|mmetsp:Transcript_28050/g.70057  ORF Transcript_28050/g.70057 Transcript_28050/m.70057 type:complete len:108 (+) Transcript_28050:129-452(+)|eukprot:CEM08004.1 unnamed protein product [Vitrella brassicaformis CCMP3155]
MSESTSASPPAASKPSEAAQPAAPTHMPPFFPIVRKGCEEVSKAFFACLEEHTQPGQTSTGLEAMQRCQQQRADYEKCFHESMKKQKPPLVRTQWSTRPLGEDDDDE